MSYHGEDDALAVHTTSTGIVVVTGKCPHCAHDAADHWSDGCKGARGGADHCRMTPNKLAGIACSCGRVWEGHPNPHAITCPLHKAGA